MIKKSILFFVYLGLIIRVLVTPSILASEPLSAIDWLAEKINDAPDFFTLQNEQISESQDINNKIKIDQLPGISKNSVGFFSGNRLGLPINAWSGETEILLAKEVKKISISELYHLNRFLKRILLVEIDPPITQVDAPYAGTAFLRSRISKLIDMGALDDAEALLEAASPLTEFGLLDLWTEVSFLTRRLDNFCEMILQSHNTKMVPSHRIVCLARSGDWNAAALALATYTSIGEIDNELETLLINYLDHEAELDLVNKDICLEKSAILLYLCGFSGIRISDSELPVKFLYSNLSRSKSLRTRISTSEEFVKSGSLDPNVLFSNYRVKEPSASGGVWARAKIVQNVDKSLNASDVEYPILFENLSAAITEFTKQNLLAQFAETYGSKFREIAPAQNFPELNEIILALIILSGEELGEWTGEKTSSSTINLALYLAAGNIGWTQKREDNYASIVPRFTSNEEGQLTLMEKTILEASFGKIPSRGDANKEILAALSDQRIGLTLLQAMKYISFGRKESDFFALQTGLASLVRLGLLADFKLIASEILLTEYFRGLLDYY